MIIQIKSSYSGPLSLNLEDGQELFISHTHVTHAYVQKQADENVVARLYLSQGELHLVPVSRKENVFLQNRPFTEDTVLGNEYLLQIKESILLFEVAGEIMVIMMGLALGYGNTSALKAVKTSEQTSSTPSLAEETQPSKSKLLCQSGSHVVREEKKAHGDEKPKKDEGLQPEREDRDDTDILLSESSTTAGGVLKSVPRLEPSKDGKWKMATIMACLMVVICVAMWVMARRTHAVPKSGMSSVVEGNVEHVVHEDVAKTITVADDTSAKDVKANPNAIPATQTTMKTEKTTPSSNGQFVATVGLEPNVTKPKTEPKAAVTETEQKVAVTLKERLILARKELEELSQNAESADASAELLDDKRFGEDVEWMTATFDKLKVSLRKVQIRELEKQMEVHQRARNLDISKFSEEATAEFQKRFKEYTAKKHDWGYNSSDIKFSEDLVSELRKGRVNPNVEVEDSNYKRYSGPVLSCILSGRIQKPDEIARELLKLGATADVCLSQKETLLKSRVGLVVFSEGGVDKMEGFLLPLLNQPDFLNRMKSYGKGGAESLAATLVILKHNLAERDPQGNMSLHVAAKIGSAKLVALMLLDGADVNATNKAGETPLHLALKYGHFLLEPLLLKARASTSLKNVKGETATDCRKVGLFFQNIEKKNYPAIRLALKNGMSPDMLDSSGATILQIACMNNDTELARLLLEFNTNLELAGQEYPVDDTPLAWAFEKKNLDIFKMLLEKGADPNVNPPGFGGNLHLLPVLCERAYLLFGDDEAMQLRWLKPLLNAKKPPKMVENWRLVIGYALSQKMGNAFITTLLDKYESFPENCSAIAMALFYGYPDSIVEKIVEKKADVNALYTIPNYTHTWKERSSAKQPRGGQKTTALWLAVEQERPKMVKLLLKNGADVKWKDANGKTVMDLPCSDEIRQMLKKTGGKEQASTPEKTEAEKEQPAMMDKTVDLGNGVTMVLKLIPKGSFTMGSPENELGRGENERQHRVTLTKDFWIGRNIVTQAQYEAITGENPSKNKKGGDYPVECVPWGEAMAFCKKLTEKARATGTLPDGYEFTLPTEAQWEYACRAGTTTALSSGENLTDGKTCQKVDEVSWYIGNSGRETHPVCMKKMNPWGLYDMLGNVYEWCRDWYGRYPQGNVVDPVGPASGSSRVVRGGSHHCEAKCCRSARRNLANQEKGYNDLSFRVALAPIDSNMSSSSGDGGKTDVDGKTPMEQAAYVNDVRVDGAELGKWTHDWDAAAAAAKKDGSPIFVNFTGSDWCGWCKLLKSKVFSQPEWMTWASRNIYLVHIDFPNDKALVPEKYRDRNRKLAQRYKVGGYPTCLLLDPATLKPLGVFGASRDITAKAFVEKVSAAMPRVKKASPSEATQSSGQQGNSHPAPKWDGTNEYINLGGGVVLKMVKIEPGSFTNTELNKEITLTREYWLGETEVTQGQYAAIMDGVRNENDEPCKTRPSYFTGEERLPVERVSWHDARAFCRKLNSLYDGKLPQGYRFDLPTEAQWEFAASDGNKSKGYVYSGGNNIDKIAWYVENSQKRTHPVGMKQANGLGLYDMNGNVKEWCRDWYDFVWSHDPETLSGMKSNSSRVIRGGSWDDRADICRSAYRLSSGPSFRYNSVGFRVALVPVDSQSSASSDDVGKTQAEMKTVDHAIVADATSKKTEYKTIVLPGGIELKLVKIEPGSFTIKEVNKTITLTREYWLGETEVTQGQYAAIMDGVVNEKGAICRPRPSFFSGSDRLPVERVSWYDAKAFCRKLNNLNEGKLPRGYRFDLPTEAQWEFAARGGNKSKGYEYSGGKDIEAVAWYVENSEKRTHPVGGKQANELGLYDMSGNVLEWCRDIFVRDEYLDDSEFLRGQPSEGSRRVGRGGACNYENYRCNLRTRGDAMQPDAVISTHGFRVALVPFDSDAVSPSGKSGKKEAELKKSAVKIIAGASDDVIDYKTFSFPNNLELKLLKIKPGSFTNAEINKEITLTREYWLGETEVTQGQYAVVMDGVVNEKGQICRPRPSHFKGDDRLPVEQVTWYNAKAFCKKLNSLFEGMLPEGYQFDLPTEAQWEFAALGGNNSQGYEYSGGDNIELVAWLQGNSGEKTHPVGGKRPNELGLYDMNGNVWEWCRDRYEKNYASDPEFLRGQPVEHFPMWRVGRGGSCFSNPTSYRLADRYSGGSWDEDCGIGFRVALVPVQ